MRVGKAERAEEIKDESAEQSRPSKSISEKDVLTVVLLSENSHESGDLDLNEGGTISLRRDATRRTRARKKSLNSQSFPVPYRRREYMT